VVTYLEAITLALREEMRRDPTVFCLGEDIAAYGGAFKVTRGLVEEFGGLRVLDTILAESAILGVAVGAALTGMRPVAEMQFADFVACGFNQLVNHAAKVHYRWGARVPMVVRLPSGGYVRGGPFHSQNPEAWFCHVPGLKVVAPSNPADARGLLKAAIRDDNPVIYLEHKFLYRRIKGDLPEGDGAVPLGFGSIARPGRDASVVTYGSGVPLALDAADRMAGEGREIEVVDLRTLVPTDHALLRETVERTHRVLVLHEACLTGGFGGEIASWIGEELFEELDAPVRRIGALDVPIPYSPRLEDRVLPSRERLMEALQDLLAY
jgi:2-oxoisovalerate dehydrogenase E1 component beta subunit